MTILIVDALAANEGRRKFSRDAIGVGPRLLAGICERHNKSVTIVRVEDILDDMDYFDKASFEVILISAMSVDEIAVKRLLKQKTEKNFKSSVFLGGPIASYFPILNELDVTAGIRGEGEKVLELLLKNDFSLHSLSENQSTQIKLTQIEKTLMIEQKAPSTAAVFENYLPSTQKITDYPDFWFSKVYVEITRGCSNHYRGSIVKNFGNCSDCGNCDDPDTILTDDCPEDIPPGCGFCSVPSTFGPPRSKSVKLVVKEIKELFSQGVRRINLSSPGFFDYFREKDSISIYSPTNPPANLQKITELLEKLSLLRDNQKEICSISIENVKPSMVTEAGADIIGKFLPNTAVSIGCETFDNNHSSAIGRPSSSVEVLKAAEFFRKAGINPQIYLIHSLPGETVESLNMTRNMVNGDLSDFAEKITVYKYLPLPNSPFTITETPLPPDRHLLKQTREKLKQDIMKFNRIKKKELITKEIHVVVAEKDLKFDQHYISYPIFSGPAVSIYSLENILGKTVLAKVTEVLSDRLVKAKVSKIIDN